MNAVKDMLKAGKTVIGAGGSATGETAVLADAGFDFILFDTQHSPVEIKQLIPAITAMRGKKAAPIVRVSDNRADLICFALDAGARGIVVPMVNTKAEAEAMVRACKYYPEGNRSNAGVRGEWGEQPTYRDYLDTVNRDLLIIPMIETNQAIANIDEILSVPGIDVLLVGPSDLSIELGVPLDYPSDTYQAGLDTIAAACKEHNVVPGMYFIPPEMGPNFYVAKGFKFFTVPWARWATEGIQKGLEGINR
jgi:2-keto-3-deoxy-L-rhamnonate aldolase RhmA